MIWGIDLPSFNAMSGGLTLISGRLFENNDEVVVDDRFAADKKLKVGDALNVKNRSFRVSGIVENGKGARIFIPRSSFPTASTDEYYWVDLIGLEVVNREGVSLGQVKELLSTGPQTVLVIEYTEEGKAMERMIPFVSAYVDGVDLPGKRISVDWQPDY